jgi:hypothetical protein
MKPLKTEFKYQGRTVRQLDRSAGAALYELRNKAEVLYGYKVIEIKIHPEQTIMGTVYPEREAYPKDEDWGVHAWSFGANNKAGALQAFNGLTKKSISESTLQCQDTCIVFDSLHRHKVAPERHIFNHYAVRKQHLTCVTVSQ